jgi:hypothetical protein
VQTMPAGMSSLSPSLGGKPDTDSMLCGGRQHALYYKLSQRLLLRPPFLTSLALDLAPPTIIRCVCTIHATPR